MINLVDYFVKKLNLFFSLTLFHFKPQFSQIFALTKLIFYTIENLFRVQADLEGFLEYFSINKISYCQLQFSGKSSEKLNRALQDIK